MHWISNTKTSDVFQCLQRPIGEWVKKQTLNISLSIIECYLRLRNGPCVCVNICVYVGLCAYCKCIQFVYITYNELNVVLIYTSYFPQLMSLLGIFVFHCSATNLMGSPLLKGAAVCQLAHQQQLHRLATEHSPKGKASGTNTVEHILLFFLPRMFKWAAPVYRSGCSQVKCTHMAQYKQSFHAM
jgi:hypothetical protein